MRNEDDLKDLILEIAAEVEEAMDMGWMTITHKFSTRLDDDRITATAVSDWMYRQGTVIWNLAMVATMEDDRIQATLVHELVHMLTACLWESLPDKVKDDVHSLNELATENVTRAILALMP